MAYPVAAGGVDFNAAGMIPKIYAKKLLVAFYAATVLAAIASTDLQSPLQQLGDTVDIRTLPDITIRNYVKKEDLVYEDPEPSIVQLLVDKGKYWAMAIDDLDKLQTDIKTYGTQWAEHASEGMKVAVDTDVLGGVYSSADTYNKGLTAGKKSGNINLGVSGTPLAITKTNIIDFLVDCSTVLDEQNIPTSQRKIVLPAWATGLILKSDVKDASMTGDNQSVLRNGRIGTLAGLEIFQSNNLTFTTDTYSCAEVIACHPTAIAFAAQVPITGKGKVETLRNPNRFGDLMRGMCVYGYKVVKDEALLHAHIYKG